MIKSWVNIDENSGFGLKNLPLGIFSSSANDPKRVGIAVGNYILDLFAVADLGYFNVINIDKNIFFQSSLNQLMQLGKEKFLSLKRRIQDLLKKGSELEQNRYAVLFNRKKAIMHLPVKIGDYTDFYSSIEHATNVGKMFRDPENALLPNWKHIPVGYHGRSSSIYVSGQNIYRPKGQRLEKGAQSPTFGPSIRMDFELEMGYIIGKETQPGQSVSTDEAMDYIFGMVIFNDWSARDIQKWEYVPLGPFLGKNFASSISPWVVTMDALEPFKVAGPVQDVEVLPYLKCDRKNNYDVKLEVGLTPEDDEESIISQSNYKYMYWNKLQQLAHHTVNGCPIKVGDLMASGTISGKKAKSYGSMLELCWGGKRNIKLNDGKTRKFLEDFDVVSMRAWCEKEGEEKISFGDVTSKILPSIEIEEIEEVEETTEVKEEIVIESTKKTISDEERFKNEEKE